LSRKKIPEFAILGHPNEGKSSVVSTLSEDDTVRISPYPGETVVCKTYPVVIDGVEIIRFTDTPGFQSPRKTLEWFAHYKGPQDGILKAFIDTNKNNDLFQDECELLAPLEKGAGIIYVADASRPVRKVDIWEMEILRLTGLPRMAIINFKSQTHDFTIEWKNEFRKHFNAIRIFNAHNATYSERLELLESLKHIDQEWQAALDLVIQAFKKDWDRRNTLTAEAILNLVSKVICHRVSGTYGNDAEKNDIRDKLETEYLKNITVMEKKTHQEIRKLFKHNIFNVDLPEESILKNSISDKSTWQLLGLNKKQIVGAAAAIGGSAGGLIDIAAAGHSFGLFALMGSALLGGSAFFGSNKLTRTKIIGLQLGGYKMNVGPTQNIQIIYLFIDRALIFYSHIINWAHGRRDYPDPIQNTPKGKGHKIGYSSRMTKDDIKKISLFFDTFKKNDIEKQEKLKTELIQTIKDWLDIIPKELSGSGIFKND